MGLALYPAQERAVTEFEAGGYQQAVWRWGRRSGKSRTAEVLAIFDAVTRDHLRAKMLPGEPRIAAIVSTTYSQAEQRIAGIAGLIRGSKRLRHLVVREVADEITFSNGSAIRAFPCSARGIRGGAWSSLILDELGHFMSAEDGNATGDRVLEAAAPSLAQFGEEGWLIAICTPLWKDGAFYKLVTRAESGKFAYMHSSHAATGEVNPTIPASWLAAREREDPTSYQREFQALWIDGAGAFLNSVDVLACRREANILPPRREFSYVGCIDPAYAKDNFALGIGHLEGERLIVDGVWVWHRAGVNATLDGVVAITNAYGVASLRTDQHSAEMIESELSRRRMGCEKKPWTNANKYEAYVGLKVGINTRACELPNDEPLTAELIGLEARESRAGSTWIGAASAGHDDRASVVAALADELLGSRLSTQGLVNVWEAYEPIEAQAYREAPAEPVGRVRRPKVTLESWGRS
ncbi:MAG: hypothetical protein M3024_14320 [Candidatus Dormibacteraeota bacterium]|nr:hypothetical protein [Candidatus Dormibacteraeota bacterium]